MSHEPGEGTNKRINDGTNEANAGSSRQILGRA